MVRLGLGADEKWGGESVTRFGNGRFLRPIKSVPRLRIPVLCDAHARLFRVTSVFTK